jgi:hypothetical protein
LVDHDRAPFAYCLARSNTNTNKNRALPSVDPSHAINVLCYKPLACGTANLSVDRALRDRAKQHQVDLSHATPIKTFAYCLLVHVRSKHGSQSTDKFAYCFATKGNSTVPHLKKIVASVACTRAKGAWVHKRKRIFTYTLGFVKPIKCL